MLEKNAKISVLRTMAGLGEEIEPHFIVPQNSITNIRQKMGPGDQRTTQMPALIPLENSIRSTQPATVKCPHCENMAKNFLYLESLIRNNYNTKSQCGLCYSSLKYLQYVNKSIMQVFGSFESIAQAAKAFTNNQARAPIPRTIREIAAKAVTAKTVNKKPMEKKSLKAAGKVTKVTKVMRPVTQKSRRNVSIVRLAGGGKVTKAPRSLPNTKNKNKNVKATRAKTKLAGALESKRNKNLASTKQKSMKTKRIRIGKVRVSAK
ncbi:uncharacterized protein [Eurosta solidaginis]|uniref:uncharacterized protein n=1 Tax=Eurosta solidaginis TaxID=178769 RepID=UPI003530DFA2